MQRDFWGRNFVVRGNAMGVIGGVEVYGELIFGYGEGAPVHISAAPARRSSPTLAIKLSRCCEVGGARTMLVAASRRVSILAIPFGHARNPAHSCEECPYHWVRSSGASAQRLGFRFQSYWRNKLPPPEVGRE